MDDVLSHILRLVRLKSCIYFMRDFRAPWAMRIDGTPFAQFHVVVRGQCVIEAESARHDAATGDVFLFPRGTAHVIADRAGRDPVPGEEVMRSLSGPEPLFETGDAATQLLCGHFEYDRDFRHPLLEELPDVIHVDSFKSLSSGSLETILPLLVREMGDGRPGSDTVVERLAEVLLIQVLRAHAARQSHMDGFLEALTDARLVRAIKLIHSRAEQRLTLDDLAKAAAMSRSAFSLLFKTATRHSPMSYLTKWRMFRARELLKSSRMPLVEVAERVGYESDVAFSRAFQREFEESPSSVRRSA